MIEIPFSNYIRTTNYIQSFQELKLIIHTHNSYKLTTETTVGYNNNNNNDHEIIIIIAMIILTVCSNSIR